MPNSEFVLRVLGCLELYCGEEGASSSVPTLVVGVILLVKLLDLSSFANLRLFVLMYLFCLRTFLYWTNRVQQNLATENPSDTDAWKIRHTMERHDHVV